MDTVIFTGRIPDEPMLRYAKAAVGIAPRGGPDNNLVKAALGNRCPILRA